MMGLVLYMDIKDYDLSKFPLEREIVVDAGYLGTSRHIIYALIEADVTKALQQIQNISTKKKGKLSFTAFVVASFARAIEAIPQVHSFLDWRHRMFMFHDVDVVTMIEPAAGVVAIPHIIRNANRKHVAEISDEIRAVQAHPRSSEQSGNLVAIAPRVPRFIRIAFFKVLKMHPPWFKRLAGTVVVTSVGMFGKGGGWGIGFLPTHNLGITVGGIIQKPGVFDGQIAIRDYLSLTLSFDHDIIDGAPAARFARILTEMIENGVVLEEALT